MNQRNAAPESCPLVCGQWFSRLKGKHGGDILISDSLSCYRAVQNWVYEWLCMNTGLVVNPQTRTFPEIVARQWQQEIEVERSGKQWVITLGLSGLNTINKNNMVDWNRLNYVMLHFVSPPVLSLFYPLNYFKSPTCTWQIYNNW